MSHFSFLGINYGEDSPISLMTKLSSQPLLKDWNFPTSRNLDNFKQFLTIATQDWSMFAAHLKSVVGLVKGKTIGKSEGETTLQEFCSLFVG